MSAPSSGLFTTSLPDIYEQFLVGPLFRPFAEVLIERVAPVAGERVLDIACGTGIVARLAGERVGSTGRVVGVDVSAPMLEKAASVEPQIDWRQGPAGALPVRDDETFDVVFCHQGLQFFPDKTAAVREMRRVSAPGGRLAVATWRSVDDIPLMGEMQQIAERHLGPFVDQRHSFGDASLVGGVVVDAGFGDVRVETVSRTVRFEDPSLFPRLNTMAVVAMSPATRAMTDAERAQTTEAIANASAELCRRRYADGAFELITSLVTARA